MQMNNFLVNLALRAAGVPSIPSPEIPLVPWSESRDPGFGIEESVQEQTAPSSQFRAPPEEPEPTTGPKRPEPERRDVAPRPEISARERGARDYLRPAPEAPERTREIRTEHHEIVREPSPSHLIEVRETIREKQIIHEKVVEREVSAEAPQREQRTVAPQAAVLPTPPVLDVASISNEVIREVVSEAPTRILQPSLSPAAPAEIAPLSRRTEDVAKLKSEEPREEHRKTSPQRRENIPTPVRAVSQPQEIMAKPMPPKFPAPAKEAHVVTPREPGLRPARAPDAPFVPAADGGKISRHEKSVEVKIGSIEIRASAPAPPAIPEPAAARDEPIEGLEAYRLVRRYSAWFRE